jgi:hypothetical protein
VRDACAASRWLRADGFKITPTEHAASQGQLI